MVCKIVKIVLLKHICTDIMLYDLFAKSGLTLVTLTGNDCNNMLKHNKILHGLDMVKTGLVFKPRN